MNASPDQCAGETGRSPRGNRASAKPGGRTHSLGIVALLYAVVFAGGVFRLWAQSDEASGISREYVIKAAFLYQFSRYVQWLVGTFSDGQTPFVIGVLGSDPFGGVLDEIAHTKKASELPIVIRRFPSLADYSPCHILFVPSNTSPGQRAEVIKRMRSSPVLLVGETSGFAAQGGTVNFYREDNKIRFEINLEAAKRQQLKISSKLLNLAKIIGTSAPDQSRWQRAGPTAEAMGRLDAVGQRFAMDERQPERH